MKTYESFNELNDDYPEIHDYMVSILDKSDLTEPISWVLGGDTFVIETDEDYEKHVRSQPFYDSAEEALPGWYLFFCAFNNSGGPSWWVPAHMVNNCDIEGKV